jgi:hypothetical protein
VCLSQARHERQRAFKARRCLIEPALLRENAAEIAMRLGEVGLERQCPLEAGRRLRQSAFEHQHRAETVVCLCEVGLELQCALVSPGRFREPTLLLQHMAEVVVGFMIGWLERQRMLEGGHCVRRMAPAQEHEAEAVVRLGEIGPKPQRLPVVSGCLIEPVLSGKDVTEVIVRVGVSRLESQCPFDQLDRDIIAARLRRNHAEKMQAIEMTRIDGTDFSVKALGLGQPAGLVVRERCGKLLGNGRRGGICRCGAAGRDLVQALRGSALFSVHGGEGLLMGYLLTLGAPDFVGVSRWPRYP